ncbi:fatty acid desaturase [Synechococcus sp. PCC 6312]|uniref:fatty acid desaturase n=1 Tax=Synechococcus sp. (strain ATCC 27167 / PCC 6312) TaxID=195253 RepID=UPI00029F4122|nr:fatty acid desaturase [Synechococcus sp. PCC 6312]AFY60498.1 fatty acid desaturase [Synechococcus sp. PCC 6312]
MQENLGGLFVAIGLIGLWFTSFGLTLMMPLDQVSPIWIGAAVWGRTFLHTGLFITAHDAIHASSFPQQHQWLKVWIGRIAVGLYAFLPYDQCCGNHWQHHAAPGQVGDPDFHNGVDVHVVQWYRKFIGEYLSGRQLLIFGGLSLGIGLILHFWFQVAWLNLVVFWGLPLILSSWQLFYFGTYLPHRQSPLPRPATNNLAIFPARPVNKFQQTSWLIYSFLSCYHFGTFHPQHHQAPHIPWYRLPLVRTEPERVARTTNTVNQ